MQTFYQSHKFLQVKVEFFPPQKKLHDLRVFNKILWVNLLFFKDDIDAGVAVAVHTTVVEGSALSFWWGSDVAAHSPAVLPHQDQSNKHDLVQGCLDPGVSVRVGRVSGKVAP